MPAFRCVVSVLLRKLGDFLYILKAGPAGGLRPPSGPATTRRLPGNRLTLQHRRSITVADGRHECAFHLVCRLGNVSVTLRY
jgi:hypothetical protein